MSNTIRIKKRAASGSAGAPSSLSPSELAFNEADLKLYLVLVIMDLRHLLQVQLLLLVVLEHFLTRQIQELQILFYQAQQLDRRLLLRLGL